MFQDYPTADPSVQQDSVSQYTPGAVRQFGEGMISGFENTSLMQAPRLVPDRFSLGAIGEPMSEDEWKRSTYYRPRIEFNESMTPTLAQALMQRQDKKDYEAWASKRGGGVSKWAGEFFGMMPDPLFMVPVFGEAAKAGLVAKHGAKIAGAIEHGVTNAALMTGLEAEHMGADLIHEEPVDLAMAVRNVFFAAGLGAALGGLLARRAPEERLAAGSKAAADMMAMRPVSVEEALGSRQPITEAVRRWLDVGGLEQAAGERAAPAAQRATAAESMLFTEGGIPAEKLEAIRSGADAWRGEEAVQLITQGFGGRSSLNEIMAAMAKPDFLRTGREKALLSSIDLTPDVSKVLDVMAKPAADRTAEDMGFLRAFKDDKLGQFFEAQKTSVMAQAEELDRQAAAIRERLSKLDAQLSAESGDAAAEAALRASSAQLREHLVAIQQESQDLMMGHPIDFSTVASPKMEFPDVLPTDATNAYARGEADKVPESVSKDMEAKQAAVKEQLKVLDATEQLSDLAKEHLETAKIEKEQLTKLSDAYKKAGECIINGLG